MDPDPLEYQRQDIDAKIDAKIRSLEDSETIRVLRPHRNTLPPISSLPVELIDGIFSYLRIPGTPPPFARGDKRDPLEWLRVAHVCHRWREIALNQPLFWSYVDFTNLSLAGAIEVLSRARNTPLYLEAKIPRKYWNDTTSGVAKLATLQEVIQQHASQIRYLYISATQTQLYKTLQALISPAPVLEYLSLSFEVYIVSSPFPTALFDGTMPRLSHLKLRGCDISWESPLLKRLTYLDIRSPSYDARPGLATWLDSLEAMPQLETLIVHSASPVAPSNASPPLDVKRSITLPCLTRLDILATPRDCALALGHLDLPTLTRLSVTTKVHSSSQLHRILPYVALHAHGPKGAQPLQSMLLYTRDFQMDILMWTVPGIDLDVRDSSAFLDAMHSARILFSVLTNMWRAKSKTHMRMFDEAIAAFPLDNLVTLTAPDCVLFNWSRHAPRWCLLECVRLGLPAANALKKILLVGKGKPSWSLLPSLTKLILVDIELTGPWILDLCDTLMKRVEKGVPLEVVDLRTCTVTDCTAIQQLIKIVSVAWNPSEEFCGTGKPDFATCYCGALSLLVKDNSEPDSEFDSDEEAQGSDYEGLNLTEYPEVFEEQSEYSE